MSYKDLQDCCLLGVKFLLCVIDMLLRSILKKKEKKDLS